MRIMRVRRIQRVRPEGQGAREPRRGPRTRERASLRCLFVLSALRRGAETATAPRRNIFSSLDEMSCREKVYPVTRREAGRGRATGGARGQGTSEARDAPGGGRAGPRRRRGADSADTADTYRQRGHGRRGAGCHLPAHASRAKQQAHLGPPSARPSSVAHSTFRHAQPPATAALSCAAGPPLPPFTSLARMRFSTRP